MFACSLLIALMSWIVTVRSIPFYDVEFIAAKMDKGEPIGGYPLSFDCPMRFLALEFAHYIQPGLSRQQLQDIADALNGTPEKADGCNVTLNQLLFPPTSHSQSHTHKDNPSANTNHGRADDDQQRHMIWNDIDFEYASKHNPLTVFVDSVHGCDDHHNNVLCAGTLTKPFHSIHKAIEVLRERSALANNKSESKSEHAQQKRIVLRSGIYYLSETLYFEHRDSNLLITNFDSELVEISGALPLNCTHEWQLYKKGEGGKNYYRCDMNQNNITRIPGLRVNGVRAIRARYPNANPELDGFGSDLQASSWPGPRYPNPEPETWVLDPEPVRNISTGDWFLRYNLGIAGTACYNFEPPAGYWCSPEPQGGGAITYRIGTGFTFNQSVLPHFDADTDTAQMIAHVWRPDHWATWMFEVAQYTYHNRSDGIDSSIEFARGGFQGARGCDPGLGCGDNFYVENVMAELDFPGEYFFNESTRVLYYYNNETGDEPPGDLMFEATQLPVLLNFSGSMDAPVTDVVLRGITFKDTAITYMEPHGMPSGGDWALQRTGAIYINGARNFTITNNVFTRLDGIGVSINRYNRNHSIRYNEVVWNGESFVTLWGDTQGIAFEDSPQTQMGMDGTLGNQPRFITIVGNLVHELGIWEKQSSFVFQAKSCSNLIANNIVYNMPRAGINFNDGFNGGSRITGNLVFNTCRESGDHGPFNSWDRQVFAATKTSDGNLNVVKYFDYLDHNFLIGNYNAQGAIDNDDGSAFYHAFNNFLVYAQMGLKSDAGGHSNYHSANIYAYLNLNCFEIAMGMDGQLPGYTNMFQNNTCILNTTTHLAYASFACNSAVNQWPMLGNNVIYQLNDNQSFIEQIGLCQLSEQEFQSKYGLDLNTTVMGKPNNTEIIEQAKGLLWQITDRHF